VVAKEIRSFEDFTAGKAPFQPIRVTMDFDGEVLEVRKGC